MVAWWPDGPSEAVSRPALRRGAAGPLDDLVAPPHDVIAPEAEERLLAAKPLQRRASRPSSGARGGCAAARRVARARGCSSARSGRRSGSSRRSSRDRTARRAGGAGSSRACGSSPTRPASSFRTSGRFERLGGEAARAPPRDANEALARPPPARRGRRARAGRRAPARGGARRRHAAGSGRIEDPDEIERAAAASSASAS